MRLLVKRLGDVHVHPYYVYVHDMVQGAEDLRTTVQAAIEIEKYVRGSTAGFNTPTFVVDAPGGGGKRVCHSAEYYDRTTGVSVFTAPSVKPGQYFLYFDPVDRLPEAGRARWADPGARQDGRRGHRRRAVDPTLTQGVAAMCGRLTIARTRG
jgi:lysine 2,3-aminomutase